MPVGCEKCVYSRIFTHKKRKNIAFWIQLYKLIAPCYFSCVYWRLQIWSHFYGKILSLLTPIDSRKLFDQSFQLTLEHFSMFEISFERFWIELNWILRTKSIKYIIYIISSLEWQRERRGYEIPGNLIDVRHNSMNPSLLERWQRILLEEK